LANPLLDSVTIEHVILEAHESGLAQLQVHPLHVDPELGAVVHPGPKAAEHSPYQWQRSRHRTRPPTRGGSLRPAQAHLHSSSTTSRANRAITARSASRAAAFTGPSVQPASPASRRRRPRRAPSQAADLFASNAAVMAPPSTTKATMCLVFDAGWLHATCQGPRPREPSCGSSESPRASLPTDSMPLKSSTCVRSGAIPQGGETLPRACPEGVGPLMWASAQWVA